MGPRWILNPPPGPVGAVDSRSLTWYVPPRVTSDPRLFSRGATITRSALSAVEVRTILCPDHQFEASNRCCQEVCLRTSSGHVVATQFALRAPRAVIGGTCNSTAAQEKLGGHQEKGGRVFNRLTFSPSAARDDAPLASSSTTTRPASCLVAAGLLRRASQVSTQERQKRQGTEQRRRDRGI